MTTNFTSFTLAALVVLTSLTANAVVVPHSKTIVVESPETHPILAEANPEAMYLHDTNDGRTLLYIEAENGRKLISLDVTDPSRRFRTDEVTPETPVFLTWGNFVCPESPPPTKRPSLTTAQIAPDNPRASLIRSRSPTLRIAEASNTSPAVAVRTMAPTITAIAEPSMPVPSMPTLRQCPGERKVYGPCKSIQL
jgi:hypothetical protein